MIIDLPDTDTGAINKKIVALREEGGAITLGRVLTLVIAVFVGIFVMAVFLPMIENMTNMM